MSCDYVTMTAVTPPSQFVIYVTIIYSRYHIILYYLRNKNWKEKKIK